MISEKNPASVRHACDRCGKVVPRGRECYLGERVYCVGCALIESRRTTEPPAEEPPKFPNGYQS